MKNSIISSLLWKYLERGSVQGISFLVSIILARIIAPGEYGIIVIITVFINLANTFIQSGFSMALLQRKDIEKDDYSSVFWISIVLSLLIYSILYIISPFIAAFYNNPEITDVLRVLSLVVIPGGINSVQNSMLIRELLFKRIFFNSFLAVIISAIVGISMAYSGFGIWALVFQQLTNITAICVITSAGLRWLPKLRISFKRVKLLISFGWKVLVSSLIDTFYNQLNSLVVGKLYSPASLAYFNKGQEFPYFVVVNIDSSIESVMLPVYARNQNNISKLKQMVRRAVSLSSYIVFPCLMGLAATSSTVVSIVLTDKWLPCVPFLIAFCFAYLFHPLNIANVQAINAVGRSDLTLKINVIKKTIAIIILIISSFFGLYAIALGTIISNIFVLIINIAPNRKLLHYGAKEQIKDILPNLLIAMVMGVIVAVIGLIDMSVFAKLIVQVMTGIFVYVLLSILFKNTNFLYILKLLRGIK